MTAVFTGKAVMLIRKVRQLLTDSLKSSLCGEKKKHTQMSGGLRACAHVESEAYRACFLYIIVYSVNPIKIAGTWQSLLLVIYTTLEKQVH